MNFFIATGWFFILVAAALAWRLLRRSSEAGTSEIKPETDSFAHEHWLNAIESIGESAVILVDSDFGFLAAGQNGAKFAGGAHCGTHLIDIVPQSAVSKFLEEVGMARRGGARSWEYLWNEAPLSVSAAALGTDKVLISMKEKIT